jgi:ppGpp synthetase/RelA/SpoT-type nucleotidyltranferase
VQQLIQPPGADDEFDEAMAWAKPLHTRNQVDNAGEIFIDDDASVADLIEPWKILNNWRASHAYPLNALQIWLRRIATSVDEKAVVSQRLKRLESIERKLVRFKTLQLSQMQDIAGCRAIVSKVEHVHLVMEKFEKSRSKHIRKNCKDYIKEPKPDGYRGIHLIYQFTGSEKTAAYNKHRVEIQIRTREQHAWATAVEAVGTVLGQDLKSGQGNPKWLRFFALMSAVIAKFEGCPVVPDLPTDLIELRDQIKSLDKDLFARGMVQACNVLTKEYPEDAHYFLICLDPIELTLEVTTWPVEKSQAANAAYTATEQKYRGTQVQVALVSANSLWEVEQAYPNFFLDTVYFSNMIAAVIGDKSAIGGGWSSGKTRPKGKKRKVAQKSP